jgi:Tc toxin complex TcA C-terminal TcB-binding domain
MHQGFLPFEGAGAVSTWKMDLPTSYPGFDYMTISDVILHIRYSARLGVDQTKVKSTLDDLFSGVSAGSGAGLALLFSLSHDFPTEWSAFVNGVDPLNVTIRRDRFPYFTQSKEITLAEFQLYGEDVTKHHAFDDPAARTAAGVHLDDRSGRARPDADSYPHGGQTSFSGDSIFDLSPVVALTLKVSTGCGNPLSQYRESGWRRFKASGPSARVREKSDTNRQPMPDCSFHLLPRRVAWRLARAARGLVAAGESELPSETRRG